MAQRTRQQQRYCEQCQKNALFVSHQQVPNHILHFLITFLTCGLWLLMWGGLAATTERQRWLCQECGAEDRYRRPQTAPKQLTVKPEEYRTWTAGQHQTTAKIVRADSNQVELESRNGQRTTVERGMLSPADNKAIDGWLWERQ